MEDDLVSHIFPLIQRDVSAKTSASKLAQKKHDILDFRCPIDFENSELDQVKCFTHEYMWKDICYSKGKNKNQKD